MCVQHVQRATEASLGKVTSQGEGMFCAIEIDFSWHYVKC